MMMMMMMMMLIKGPFGEVGCYDDVIHVEERCTFVQQVVNILTNNNYSYNY